VSDSPSRPDDEAEANAEETTPQPRLPVKAGSEGDGDEEGGLPQFITPLTSIEQQVGSHIVNALQHPGTVAVLSTVAVGQGGQNIVSVGLDAELLGQVEKFLLEAKEDRTQRVPCIGFHCLLKERQAEEAGEDEKGETEE
jgi:hypothetical protein